MFSPILPTSAERVDSTVPSPSGSADECGDVGRILLRHQPRAIGGQLEELVVLGDEVGLAVDFENAAQLAVGGDVDSHHAFRGNAGRGLAGLVAQLDAQDFLGLRHVAAASVSAFLHSIIGASVFSRSSLTMLAVISAIALTPESKP